MAETKRFPQKAFLTLPSKSIGSKQWSLLPLQAGEAVPKHVEWWPWQVDGLALDPLTAAVWLGSLPLANNNKELGQELLWWSHLERWVLSLIAQGLWLPKVELNECTDSPNQAKWVPLLSNENERRRLEEFANRLPLVATCGISCEAAHNKSLENSALASIRPKSNRVLVANLLDELIDVHLREDFTPTIKDTDPLLQAWQNALSSSQRAIDLNDEDLSLIHI